MKTGNWLERPYPDGSHSLCSIPDGGGSGGEGEASATLPGLTGKGERGKWSLQQGSCWKVPPCTHRGSHLQSAP